MNAPLIDDRTLPHLLAVLVLVSRIGDALSTYLLSPTLLLEMNVIVSRGPRGKDEARRINGVSIPVDSGWIAY